MPKSLSSRKSITIGSMLLMLFLQLGCSRNPADLLEEANNHYEAGNAEQASLLYKEILSRQKKPMPTKDQLFESEFKLILCKIMESTPDLESDIKNWLKKQAGELTVDHIDTLLDRLLDHKKVDEFLATLKWIKEKYPENKELNKMIWEKIKRFEEIEKDSFSTHKMTEIAKTVGG